MGIDPKYRLDQLMSVAYDYEARGENLHAIQIYYSILKDAPDYFAASFSLAGLFEKQGNIDSAQNLLNDLLERNPENNSIRLYLAQLLIRNSQWENVIEVLHSIDINKEPLTSFLLGYSFFMLGDYEPAKINFMQFVSLGKKTELLHETYIYLAKTEIYLRNFNSALGFAKKAEAVYSNFWELNLVSAIIYFNLEMYTHAVSAVSKSIKLNPGEPSGYKWAGKIYLRTGEYLKAEENFLKHIEMIENPDSEIYSELGEACLKNKRTESALEYFKLALLIDPLNKFAVEGERNAAFILQSNINNV